MITRVDVADLQPGDIVELRGPSGLIVRGPLTTYGEGSLVFGPNINTGAWTVRTRLGDPGGLFAGWDLAVVSRAPRPLYVNHPRTEPVPGDVVRDADSDDAKVWLGGRNYDDEPCWLDSWRMVNPISNPMPKRLRLLVDGETGQVVQ